MLFSDGVTTANSDNGVIIVGKRGPKPLSGNVLAQRGSRLATQRLASERAASERAAISVTVGATVRTDPPAWLSDEAQLIYNQAVEQLVATGVNFIDRNVLGRYCVIFIQWLKDKAFVEQYGSSHSSKNSRGALSLRQFPQYRSMIQGSAELSRLEKSLGLSAEGRAALGIVLKPAPTPEQQEGEDKVKRFFNPAIW
jgi:P27 family predicted phage terminase small subunit